MRKIRKEEYELLVCLLREVVPRYDITPDLIIEDLDDGGMGSYYFHNSKKKYNERIGYKTISEKEFVDSDGTLIFVALIIDEENQLFELDIWRVDYNPILSYPVPGNTQNLLE